MTKKIVVSLLSISLMTTLIIGIVNPSYVMAIAGLSSLDVKTIEKTQVDSVEELRAGFCDLAQRMGRSTQTKCSSGDEAVVIEVCKNGQNLSVSITADTNKMPADMTINDIGKIIEYAKDYLKPIFSEKQALGLCGILLGDAYAQQKQGKDTISITKNFEEITIIASGEISTGQLKVDIKNTLGVKKCQPNKSKTMGTKALPL